LASQFKGPILPIRQSQKKEKARVPTEEEKKSSVFTRLRKARTDVRLVGIREKRAKAAIEDPEAAAKAKAQGLAKRKK